MLGRILLGLILIGVGFFFAWKTDIPLELIGPLRFGRFFSGGSRLVYKLIGIIIIFIGALVVAGLQDDFMAATLGSWLTF